jgi:hypothetical protein
MDTVSSAFFAAEARASVAVEAVFTDTVDTGVGAVVTTVFTGVLAASSRSADKDRSALVTEEVFPFEPNLIVYPTFTPRAIKGLSVGVKKSAITPKSKAPDSLKSYRKPHPAVR